MTETKDMVHVLLATEDLRMIARTLAGAANTCMTDALKARSLGHDKWARLREESADKLYTLANQLNNLR